MQYIRQQIFILSLRNHRQIDDVIADAIENHDATENVISFEAAYSMYIKMMTTL